MAYNFKKSIILNLKILILEMYENINHINHTWTY